MHPLRLLLYISLVIALAIAWGFGSALEKAGADRVATVTLSVLVFAAFMLPWGGVFVWALRRARDLDELTERARRVGDGSIERPIADREFHGELDDLARAIEEMRSMIVRQRAAHEEHRAAMEEIVASLGEGLIAVDPKGRVVVANARVGEIFGIGEALVGRSFLEVVRKQPVVAALDKALHGHASSERVSIGDERQIEVRVFPVEASAEIAAVALFIDVTTIERLQQIRKDFLDDFSHEVRTPLAGLRSATETMEEGRLSPADEQRLRQVILRQLGRIERLVKDLSELNTIESGNLVLQRRSVNLRELLDELCADFRQRAPRDLRFTLGGDDTHADVDPARVQQIFSNLLDNACKHGGGRGEILIEVGRENGDAIVRVSDEGSGIPPSEVERIFHRFYRVDKSRSQSVSGAGLGLAIAKHLVALHGGAIKAYNRSEGGATFEVRLPAA
jgi:PAS domain S-box-containing protein